MDFESALRLTRIFRDEAEHRRLDRSSICISTATDSGAEISAKVTSPVEAAQYLRFLLKNDHPLFQPGRHQFAMGELADPIVFKAWGRYRRPESNLEFAVMSVRLRFFQEDGPSELCFDDDFCRTDWELPLSRTSGPKIADFIHVLEKAGDKWQNINLTPLLDHNPQRRPFYLVPKP